MSHNASKYEHLKNAGSDPVQQHDLEVIARVENDLNTRPHTFISRERVAAAADGIRSGDIICYCSGVEGLDIAHVAMAWVTDPEGNLVFGDAPARPFARLDDGRTDGYLVSDRCWGTYLHGVLDNAPVVDALLAPFADRLSAPSAPFDYAAFKEEQYNRLADHVRKYLDMNRIYDILTIK